MGTTGRPAESEKEARHGTPASCSSHDGFIDENPGCRVDSLVPGLLGAMIPSNSTLAACRLCIALEQAFACAGTGSTDVGWGINGQCPSESELLCSFTAMGFVCETQISRCGYRVKPRCAGMMSREAACPAPSQDGEPRPLPVTSRYMSSEIKIEVEIEPQFPGTNEPRSSGLPNWEDRRH